MWLSLSYTETTDRPHWIFRTILSLRSVFSSVPVGSGSASMVQGHTSPNLGLHVLQQAWSLLPQEAAEQTWSGLIWELFILLIIPKNTLQSSVDTALGTCAPLFEVQTLHISCLLALEKYLRYLSVKPSESPPSSLPGSAPEGWNLFFRLDFTQHDLCHLQARSGWLMGCRPSTMRSRGVWGC